MRNDQIYLTYTFIRPYPISTPTKSWTEFLEKRRMVSSFILEWVEVILSKSDQLKEERLMMNKNEFNEKKEDNHPGNGKMV